MSLLWLLSWLIFPLHYVMFSLFYEPQIRCIEYFLCIWVHFPGRKGGVPERGNIIDSYIHKKSTYCTHTYKCIRLHAIRWKDNINKFSENISDDKKKKKRIPLVNHLSSVSRYFKQRLFFPTYWFPAHPTSPPAYPYWRHM